MTLLKDVNIGEEFEYYNKRYVRVELSDNILKNNEITALEKWLYFKDVIEDSFK